MIHLLFLSGGIGFSSADPEDATEYYRQYLDDPKVMVLTARSPIGVVALPTSEDLDYLRRYLDDVLV